MLGIMGIQNTHENTLPLKNYYQIIGESFKSYDKTGTTRSYSKHDNNFY